MDKLNWYFHQDKRYVIKQKSLSDLIHVKPIIASVDTKGVAHLNQYDVVISRYTLDC